MYEIITTEEGVRRACEHLSTQEAFAIDTETTHLDEKKGRLRLIQCATPERTFIFDNDCFNGNGALKPLANLLSSPKPRKCAHNAKFDLHFINEYLGVEVNGIFDTMLASQLDTAGYRDIKHGLDAVAKRYLDQEVPKEEQLSNWSGQLSTAQYEYAARDAEILLPLRSVLSKNLREKGLVKAALIEFNAIQALTTVERNGFPVHKQMYTELVEKLGKERDSIAAELQELLGVESQQDNFFGPPEKVKINLNSHLQIAAAYQRLGVPLNTGTGKAEIKRLVGKYAQLEPMQRYREFEKLMTGFGQNFLDLINDLTWRVYADFRQCGANTGRLSASEPNVMQTPTRDDVRSCFRCKPDSGNVLVVSDYGQIELRLLAHNSGDSNMIKGFKSGMDYHKAAAQQFLGIIDPDKITKQDRKFSKVLNFAVVYGQHETATAALLQMEVTKVRPILKRFNHTFQGMNRHLAKVVIKGMREKMVRTGSGRIIYLDFDENDKQSVSHAERNCKNGPIQGGCSDILKTAFPLLHIRLCGTSGKIVNLVHDEIIVECKEEEAEEIKEIVSSTMIEAAQEYIYEVPVTVDAKICESWADKE